jgi:hypothetical protein
MLAGAVTTFVHGARADGFAENITAVMGIVLIGVGGSLLATAMVARLVANQVFGMDVGAALEALRGTSHLARANQCLTITLEVEGGEVVAIGKHEFDLLSASPLAQLRTLSLYTDVSSDGGFFSIKEPDGNELKGEQLEPFLKPLEGKVQFAKKYFLRPGVSARFVVQTFGRFQLTDRLIWTVEHVSSDFVVRIIDRRAAELPACVKVNHHRREAIVENAVTHQAPHGVTELEIDYLGEVLPYQGFELQWQG